MKRAKALGIETVSELEDLISNEFDESEPYITGADFEIAKKKLRLEESKADKIMKPSDGGEFTIMNYNSHFDNDIAAKNMLKKYDGFVAKLEKDHRVEVSFGSIYIQPK